MSHSHANWYLLELKDTQPEWFCELIDSVIKIQWELDDNEKSLIYNKLLLSLGISDQWLELVPKGTEHSIIDLVATSKEKDISSLFLTKLTHGSWVNALIKWEFINFSDWCTLIYWLNWQWKSWYFRILHELAGWEIEWKHAIKSNINIDTEEPLDVSVDYVLNWTSESYNYVDKSLRGIDPFDAIKVFDSHYVSRFLSDKEVKWSIEPLWINMFWVINKILGEFTEKIKLLKKVKEWQLPNLESLLCLIKSSKIKDTLSKRIATLEEKSVVILTSDLLPEEETSLIELDTKISSIQKNNSEDSVWLKRSHIKDLESMITFVDEIEGLNNLWARTALVVSWFLKAKDERDKKKEGIKILEGIPWKDTHERESFIQSWDKLGKKLEQSWITNNSCLYCQQELIWESLELLKAYSWYLSDRSQVVFNERKEEIEQLINIIDSINTDHIVPERILSEFIKGSFDDLVKLAKKQKAILIESLSEVKVKDWVIRIEIEVLKTRVIQLSESINIDIKKASMTFDEKKKEVCALEKKKDDLSDKKHLHNWYLQIKKWYDLNQQISILDSHSLSNIKSFVSKKSTEVTEKLLTHSLVKAFNEVLPKIRTDLSHIELKKWSTSWWVPQIKLSFINKSEDIEVILSEWEQKAVCLALFIAEVTTDWIQAPIVFDDPVTSLDHHVKKNLAKIVWEMSSRQQIIVLTHDLIFANDIASWLSGNKNFLCHYLEKISAGSWKVHHDTTPKMNNYKLLFQTACETIKRIDDQMEQKDKHVYISSAFNDLRKATEWMIEDLLFAKTINRYDDHVNVRNLLDLPYDEAVINSIVELHGKISEKWEMHWKSDPMISKSDRREDWRQCKVAFEEIRTKLKELSKIQKKKREEIKKSSKKNYSFT